MIYQVQQTSSQCPQCSRHKLITQQSPSQQSSQNQQQQPSHHNHNHNRNHKQKHHRIVIPISKKPNQYNKNIQQTLNILQKQIQKLKNQNLQKQRKIKKLQQQINKKSERYNRSNGKVGAIYEYQLSRRSNKYQQVDHHRKSAISKQKRVHTQYPIQQPVYYPTFNTKTPTINPSHTYSQIQQIQKKIKQLTQQKNNKISFLQQQLQRVKQKYAQMEQKLYQQLNDNQWLTKFCLLFVEMAQQISKMQGENIVKPQASLRKNTKIAWKYIKCFVKQVIG